MGARITTVSDDQGSILRDIAILHNGGRPYHLDVTYSTGAFWKGTAASLRPRLRMNYPVVESPEAQVIADVRALPLREQSVESIVFDPPFIHAPGKNSIIGNRFGGYRTQDDLFHMYRQAIDECFRVLKPGGLLVWKCQDIVQSGKQVWNHIKIYHHCMMISGMFTMEDLFILTKKGQIQGYNHAKQYHARRAHSYFLVFRRQ